jgi:hypothetical protein
MKKSLKDKIKFNLKEMWEDETEEQSDNRSLGKKLLEVPLNLIRFELFYPKMQEGYDVGGTTGYWPKGAFHAFPINIAAGAGIGYQINGEQGAGAGAFIGMLGTCVQLFFGRHAIDGGIEYFSDKLKENRRRKEIENKKKLSKLDPNSLEYTVINTPTQESYNELIKVFSHIGMINNQEKKMALSEENDWYNKEGNKLCVQASGNFYDSYNGVVNLGSMDFYKRIGWKVIPLSEFYRIKGISEDNLKEINSINKNN